MRIQATDGAIIELPDDATDDQIKGAMDSYNASLSNKPVDTISAQLDELKKNIPTVPDELPYGMTQGVIDAVTKQTQAFNKKVDDVKADPMRRAMFEQGLKASGGEAFGVSAMNELVALGKGTADLADEYLPEFASNALHGFSGSPQERMANRAKEMGIQNASQEGLDLSHPFASMGGRAIPYLLTDIVGSPVIGGAVSKAAKLTKPARSAAMRGLEKLEQAAESSTSPTKQKLSELFVEPLVTSGKHFAEKVDADPEYTKALAALGRAPLLGAAEGAANYNMTAGEGAVSSTIGQALGNLSNLTYLGKPAKTTTKSEKLAIKNATRSGYTPPPGMMTGNIMDQRFEAALRGQPGFDKYMKNFDNANEAAKARMAGKAMGIKNADSKDLTPEHLDSYIREMKGEFNDFAQNTTGKITPAQMVESGKILKRLQRTALKSKVKSDDNSYKIAKSVFDSFKSIAQPQRDATGKLIGYKYDGSNYQEIYSLISDKSSEAFHKGNKRLGDSLNKFKDILDDSLEQGMNKETVTKFKDLRERYFATNLVAKKGMDPLGGIDTKKLREYLMSDDEAVRTLTNKGGRIKHLHDIVKISEVEKRQGGKSDFNDSGVTNDNTKTDVISRVLKMPFTSTLSPSKRTGMSLYMSGYPAVTGYTGIPKPAISRGIRATGQAGGFLGAMEDQGRSLLDPNYDEYKKNQYDELLEAIKGQ